MPGPRAVQNLQMPHPRDWQGGQMPRSSPGGGWAQVELTDALYVLLISLQKLLNTDTWRKSSYCYKNATVTTERG